MCSEYKDVQGRDIRTVLVQSPLWNDTTLAKFDLLPDAVCHLANQINAFLDLMNAEPKFSLAAVLNSWRFNYRYSLHKLSNTNCNVKLLTCAEGNLSK